METSSKLIVLRAFFRALPPDERIVVVSGFSTTLDLVARLCESENIKYARLQGSTPPKERTSIVRVFNTSGKILLLSTKAGGVGLNLVGANRLVLVDSSWNPAHDLQAQARIWRDGQTKSCYIYRLLSTGTIEERMFQRQELKGALARTLGFRSTSARQADGGGTAFPPNCAICFRTSRIRGAIPPTESTPWRAKRRNTGDETSPSARRIHC